jgi:prevent-host-death family protein
MSVKISAHEVQSRFSEMLDDVVKSGEEVIVQRNGKDCAVLVSLETWRRGKLKKRLDAFGPGYRLSPAKQARAEELLARNQDRMLTAKERRELADLLRECESIMTRRGKALDGLR